MATSLSNSPVLSDIVIYEVDTRFTRKTVTAGEAVAMGDILTSAHAIVAPSGAAVEIALEDAESGKPVTVLCVGPAIVDGDYLNTTGGAADSDVLADLAALGIQSRTVSGLNDTL